jgi:hypothetical protein
MDPPAVPEPNPTEGRDSPDALRRFLSQIEAHREHVQAYNNLLDMFVSKFKKVLECCEVRHGEAIASDERLVESNQQLLQLELVTVSSSIFP